MSKTDWECVQVFVCVWEREKASERDSKREREIASIKRILIDYATRKILLGNYPLTPPSNRYSLLFHITIQLLGKVFCSRENYEILRPNMAALFYIHILDVYITPTRTCIHIFMYIFTFKHIHTSMYMCSSRVRSVSLNASLRFNFANYRFLLAREKKGEGPVEEDVDSSRFCPSGEASTVPSRLLVDRRKDGEKDYRETENW